MSKKQTNITSQADFTWRQHFIPQFYLKQFATQPGTKQLWVTPVDKLRDPRISTSSSVKKSIPKKVGLYPYLYASQQGGRLDNSVEFQLGRLETEAAHTFRRFLASSYACTSDDKVVISLFLATLHTRNPRLIAEISKIRGKGDRSPEQICQALNDPTFADLAEREDFRRLLLDGSAITLKYIMAMEHDYFYFDTPILVTSDTPFYAIQGAFNSSSCIAFFPMNSKCLLVLRHGCRSRNVAAPNTAGELADGANMFTAQFATKKLYSNSPLPPSFGEVST